MKRLSIIAIMMFLPLSSALACDGDCVGMLPPTQPAIDTAPKPDKGQAPTRGDCVGPGCTKSVAPSAMSLLSADVAGAKAKKAAKPKPVRPQ